jgi:hypothetical protein
MLSDPGVALPVFPGHTQNEMANLPECKVTAEDIGKVCVQIGSAADVLRMIFVSTPAGFATPPFASNSSAIHPAAVNTVPRSTTHFR